MTCQAYRRQHGRDYISVMPCNLYGPNDNFNLETSHVIPALIRKFHEAKISNSPSVTIWGSGAPLREFLHVNDLAVGVVFCLDNYHENEHINCGAGFDLTIKEIADMLRKAVGYTCCVRFDTSKPDGTPRKIMDSSRLRALGWEPDISLQRGLTMSYKWYLDNLKK